MNHRDEIIFKKVIQEIIVTEGILRGETQESFLNNETIKRAVAMTAINIGELVKTSPRRRASNIGIPHGRKSPVSEM